MSINEVNNQNSNYSGTKNQSQSNIAGIVAAGETIALAGGLGTAIFAHKKLADSFEKETGKVVNKAPFQKGMMISGLLGLLAGYIYSFVSASKINVTKNE